MKALKSLVVAVLVCLVCYGVPSSVQIYDGASYTSSGYTYYRDGVTKLFTDNALQPIFAGTGDTIFPPTNTASTSYLVGNNKLWTGTQSATKLSSNPLGADSYGDGEWNTVVSGGDTAGSNRYFARVFSSTTVPLSAYYKDTSLFTGGSPPQECQITTDIIADTINPAYTGLRCITNPIQTTVRSGALYLMTGSVNTVSGGGNNTLADSAVMVYWRTNSSDATGWKPLSGFGVVNGAFTGYYNGGSEVIVGMPGSGGNLPNSAGGQGPIVVIPAPEPSLAFAGLFALALLRKVR